MEEVSKQYGNVTLVVIVFVALGILVAWLCKADDTGFVAKQFQSALQSFFTRMNSIV